jgi:hypothetical protein
MVDHTCQIRIFQLDTVKTQKLSFIVDLHYALNCLRVKCGMKKVTDGKSRRVSILELLI